MTGTGETAEQRRPLVPGDRIKAYPCDVTIESVGSGGAWGFCSSCADHHVIDHPLYEAGRGPWRLVLSGSTGAGES